MDHEQLAESLGDAERAVRAIGEALDASGEGADGMFDLEARVRATARRLREAGLADDALGAVLMADARAAVSYMLRFDNGRAAFEPQLALADGTTDPPQLEDQPDDVLGRWRDIRDAVTIPAWRSRLGHLLVLADRVVTGKIRYQMANEVVGEYLSLVPGSAPDVDHVGVIRAAVSVARQFGLESRRAEALVTATTAASAALAEERPAAGIVLGLTQLLVDQPDPPPDVDALLERARSTYSLDPFNLDEVIVQQLARSSNDAERTAQLWRDRVQLWLDAADRDGGMRRAIFLKAAVEHATGSGDRELRESATARLQEVTLADLEMQGVESGMILRGEHVASVIRSVTEASSWADALDAFAVLGPPTGDAAANERTVDEHGKMFVFSSLFPITAYGGDGLPRFTAATDDERAAYRLTQHETFNLQMYAGLVAEALLRLPVRHTLPSEEELAVHFARSPLLSPSLARALSRAFHRWWAGDYEAAAFTAVPRVETLARNLLLAQNVGIYRLQRERSPGQYPGLGWLLANLNELGLDRSWFRYLQTTLADPVGWNLRNEISHGFVDNLGIMESALILQCAAHLALLPLLAQRPESQAETAPMEAGQ